MSSTEPCVQQLDSEATDNVNTDEEQVTCPHMPARYVLALLGFLGFAVSFSMRASLSVAVVAMVNATSSLKHAPDLRHGVSNNVSEIDKGYEGGVLPDSGQGELDWDETTQGVVLGSYYYGYTVTQMVGGWMALRLGAQNLLGWGMMGSSLVTFLLPLAARAAPGYFIAIRVCQGIAESVLFPAMSSLWAVWAPLQERGRLVNFTYSSTEIGTVLGMLTSGLLCRYGFAGGWPSVFYIHGILGCIWALVWMLLVYESPSKHPRLTHKERAVLEKLYVPRKGQRIPWCRFLRSPALWTVAANHFMITWGFSSMATMLPTYMANIQHFDIQQNGLLSSLPFLAQGLSLMGGSFLMDALQSCHCLTTHRSRLLLNGTGGILGAGFFVAMGHVPERSHVMAVAVVTVAMACAALCVCCLRVAHLDLSPTHAGTLYGITNGLACSAGFLAPALVGVLTENQQTVAQWRIFFYITASIYLVCPVLSCLFSAKGRNFDKPKDRKSGEEEEKAGSLMVDNEPEVL